MSPTEATETPLPPWAAELRLRYVSGEASMFLLHGNVRDVFPWTDAQGQTRYVPLREYLERFLSRTKDLVTYYNMSEGLEFPDRKVGTSHQERKVFRCQVLWRPVEG